MFPGPHAARLQTTAGAALLHRSTLVKWSPSAGHFSAVNEDAFEESARKIDSAFGRLFCWMTFSSGVEFLGKGLCLDHGIDFWSLEKAWVCDIPKYPVSRWLEETDGRPKTCETTSFGTIGSLTRRRKGRSPIEQLAVKCAATPDQNRILLGTFTLLGTAIRNRDAHAYIPNVRAAHHWLVGDLFVNAINLLVGWIPNGGSRQLQLWLDHAKEFIQSLPPVDDAQCLED